MNKLETSQRKDIINDVKSSSPEVSVIIPVYNCSDYILETLESVFAQTFSDYEIIIVNDGSNDTVQLEKVLDPYMEKLTYIKQENQGVMIARNRAIENAKGKYLAFLDSDDVWLPNYLEVQLEQLAEKKCDLIYSDAHLFGEGVKRNAKYSDKALSIGRFTIEKLIKAECCPITSGTVALRSKVLENGMFDPDVPWMGMEDFDLWFRMAKNGVKLDYHKEAILNYRVHAESISGDRLSIIERSRFAVEYVRDTYELTESEKEACKWAINDCNNQIDVEKAKLLLINKEYDDALTLFQKVEKNTKQLKLRFVIFLLKLSPNFTLSVLKLLQPAEYNVIQANRK